jgi:hypothetical protein
MTQVVLYDYFVQRRMVYTLTPFDFEQHAERFGDSDEMLEQLRGNPIFVGRSRWCDLELKHLHFMALNLIKLLETQPDGERGDKNNEVTRALIFIFCCFVRALQRKDSHIDMLRITRATADGLIYDYTATLDIELVATPAGFHIVEDA